MSDPNIETIVKSIIEAQIIQALNNAPDAIDKLVKAALARPVDTSGKFDGYGNKMPYLDWMVGEEIRRAATRAVYKVVAESEERIEAAVRAGLNEGTIIDALVKSFVTSANEDWRINVSFVAKERDSRY